jgi:phage/plasmid-like protein (TIGR03299 family)
MTANVETMAYRYAERRDVPWHGLGVKIDRNEYISAAEFQKRAKADWTISKRPVWYKPAPDVPSVCDPNHFVLQRDDTHAALSIVGTQYKPLQNTDIFQFFHEFCERGDMVLETGGILDEGRKVWALAALKKGFTLANNDSVTGYCLMSDARDGGAARGKYTATRVVCANTLAVAFGEKNTNPEFRLNHRSKYDAEQAKKMMGLSTDFMRKLQEQSEYLTERRMSGVAFKEFLERLFPSKEVVVDEKRGITEMRRPRAFEYASDALESQTGANKNAGTWWQGYNAITYMLDHNKNRISDNESRLNNSWFGAGAKIREDALKTVLEMAK